MTEEMKKRLEEVATKYAINDDSLIDSCDTTSVSNGFLAGAEYGYNEAIRMAKEYLEKKKADIEQGILHSNPFIDTGRLCGRADIINEIINELFKED